MYIEIHRVTFNEPSARRDDFLELLAQLHNSLWRDKDFSTHDLIVKSLWIYADNNFKFIDYSPSADLTGFTIP